MLKRMIFMLISVSVVFGTIFGFQRFKAKVISEAIAARRNPVQTVSTITATSQKWQSRLKSVGSTRAVKGADLSFEVSGIVSAIFFQSGSNVKKGTPLIELNAAEDIAHLNSLKANAALAQKTYDRDRTLVNSHAVSQQTVDNDLATLESADAQVVEQQALVNYKTIEAPFAGRLGIRRVDLGQYISAGTPIVSLQQLNPIFVDFFLPQQSLARIKVGQPVTVMVDTYPGATFHGTISSINSIVSAATRNIQIRATLENGDERLLPGMFASVSIDVGAPKAYVTLPKTAIAYNSYGDVVYLVKNINNAIKGRPQGIAKQTFVAVGPSRGNQVAVLSGVKDGDIVITAGQLKLHNGTPVTINNLVQPPNSVNPSVADES